MSPIPWEQSLVPRGLRGWTRLPRIGPTYGTALPVCVFSWVRVTSFHGEPWSPQPLGTRDPKDSPSDRAHPAQPHLSVGGTAEGDHSPAITDWGPREITLWSPLSLQVRCGSRCLGGGAEGVSASGGGKECKTVLRGTVTKAPLLLKPESQNLQESYEKQM